MLDDEADDGSFADDPDLRSSMRECVTEADVELHECKRDLFRERVYSINDITIGLDTTPVAAAACGIPRAVSGGKLAIDQRRLRQSWTPRRRPSAPASFHQQTRRLRSE